MKKLAGRTLLLLLLIPSSPILALEVTGTSTSQQSPVWANDLVVYEIATKAFTSPNGPETGTFDSLRHRLPYLQNLGITGIWLTGHSLSDAHHFYNIWTQYAVVEPDRIDPSLGTSTQFKAFVDDAHRHGIHVFLDVITHGVMRESSLVEHHPEWFRGGSWGMIDYDWQGGHTDLDDWWVKTWSSYVTQYGIDGFRLDVDIYRPDLWSRVRQNAARAGHPIVIFNEVLPVIPGVTDFTQGENRISDPLTRVRNKNLMDDLPAFYRERFDNKGDFGVAIQYTDNTSAEGSTRGGGTMLQVVRGGFTTNRIEDQSDRPGGQSELHLIVNGVESKEIKNVIVTRLDDVKLETPKKWTAGFDERETLKMEGSPPKIDLYLSPFFGYSSSVELSCHDDGWSGFPSDEDPYVAQGSRATFGYSFLFTPMIPIQMAGEEFDANFHALPNLSPDVYGGADPGKGRWLYGAQLDWTELRQSGHRNMLEDVKKMLAIRWQERAVLAANVWGHIEPNLVAVPYRSDIQVPVPYMRWNANTAIIIVANRSTEMDAHLQLHFPLEKLGGGTRARYKVTDLWNNGASRRYSARTLASLQYVVKRDKKPHGGIGLIKVELIH